MSDQYLAAQRQVNTYDDPKESKWQISHIQGPDNGRSEDS